MVLFPKHILEVGTLTIGFGTINKLNVAILVHVLALPITVPEPTIAGGNAVATTLEPESVFGAKPVKPTQLNVVAPEAEIFTELFEPLKLFIQILAAFKLIFITGRFTTVTVLTAECVQVAASPIKE
jgi:hypothetical protein